MDGLVSFKPGGRLGNWMMKACTCIAYAMQNGRRFSMPISTNSQLHNPVYYTELHDLAWIDDQKVTVTIKEEKMFKYTPFQAHVLWGGQILLDGYFQNFQYFEKYRNQLIDILGMPKELLTERVSIHVRRGDYLTIPDKHIVPDVEWYHRAASFFPGSEFAVFSDDIEWCKNNLRGLGDCVFMEGFDELTDFKMIASCAGHINSSSTFSLMAAWFSPKKEKLVITPERWMTPSKDNGYTETIIPKEWIRLK